MILVPLRATQARSRQELSLLPPRQRYRAAYRLILKQASVSLLLFGNGQRRFQKIIL